MTTNTEEAYADGEDAYYRDDYYREHSENPHDTWSPEYVAWNRGWIAARDSVEEYAERPPREY